MRGALLPSIVAGAPPTAGAAVAAPRAPKTGEAAGGADDATAALRSAAAFGARRAAGGGRRGRRTRAADAALATAGTGEFVPDEAPGEGARPDAVRLRRDRVDVVGERVGGVGALGGGGAAGRRGEHPEALAAHVGDVLLERRLVLRRRHRRVLGVDLLVRVDAAPLGARAPARCRRRRSGRAGGTSTCPCSSSGRTRCARRAAGAAPSTRGTSACRTSPRPTTGSWPGSRSRCARSASPSSCGRSRRGRTWALRRRGWYAAHNCGRAVRTLCFLAPRHLWMRRASTSLLSSLRAARLAPRSRLEA